MPHPTIRLWIVLALAGIAQEPKFVLDIMQRRIDWVAKYIGE
jgi:hypothetical protein